VAFPDDAVAQVTNPIQDGSSRREAELKAGVRDAAHLQLGDVVYFPVDDLPRRLVCGWYIRELVNRLSVRHP
jgi:hypothetical protein